MALGTSRLLTQLSIVVITVINNILLVRYGAASVYGADILAIAITGVVMAGLWRQLSETSESKNVESMFRAYARTEHLKTGKRAETEVS